MEPVMTFHPDVLAAHAQFGGDLESMQKCYEWYDLKKDAERFGPLLTDLRAFYQMMAGKADTPLERQFAEHIGKQFIELGDQSFNPSPTPRVEGSDG
jgi:hypothetical protein